MPESLETRVDQLEEDIKDARSQSRRHAATINLLKAELKQVHKALGTYTDDEIEKLLGPDLATS